jgi:hypothetical protein
MSDRPTNEFARLDPTTPLAQPEVRHVGPGWDNPGMLVDRQDPVTYLPFQLPGGALLPAPEPPPKPKPPELTEDQKRERLAQIIAAQAKAKAAMDDAVARHERALADEARCRKMLASYATLPAEIGAAKERALRAGTDAALPDALRARLAARGEAEAELLAAQRAVATFVEEREQATRVHSQSIWPLREAQRAVIAIECDRLRTEVKPLEEKVAAYRQILRWDIDAGPWVAVAEALMADPMGASIAVRVPDAPLPDAPPVAMVPPPPPPSVVKLMRPIGDPRPMEVLTEAELAARERANRARGDGLTEAQRVADAIARSRRGA